MTIVLDSLPGNMYMPIEVILHHYTIREFPKRIARQELENLVQELYQICYYRLQISKVPDSVKTKQNIIKVLNGWNELVTRLSREGKGFMASYLSQYPFYEVWLENSDWDIIRKKLNWSSKS